MSQSISLAYKGKNVKRAPWWVEILDASKEWGTPPWKIMDGTKLLWFARYSVRREMQIEFAPKPKES